METNNEVNVFISKFDGIIEETNNAYSSAYFLPGTDKYLPKIPGKYILGVGYKERNRFVDLQTGVTGKIAKNESTRDAVIREIGEELGLKVAKKFITFNGMYRNSKNNIYFYTINANNCIPITEQESLIEPDRIIDTNNRIAVFIYGSLNELKNLVSKMRYVLKSNDNGAYIGIIPKIKAVAWYYYATDILIDNRFRFYENDIRASLKFKNHQKLLEVYA